MSEKPLNEKDFIHEEYGRDPTPFWIWSFIILFVTALVWVLMLWYSHVMNDEAEQNPFLQVTNREFSLFLWQNPEHMRVHAKNKTGYLTGFHYLGKVGLDASKAEDFVDAPPELLFQYHTWQRLLGDIMFDRVTNPVLFAEFLQDAEEWQQASSSKEAQQAFIGWLNYFKEGDAINTMQTTYGELDAFLEKYPQYSRSRWEQLIEGYLKSEGKGDALVPSDEIAPFLRVALFNYRR